MLDVQLMWVLLRALPQGCQLLLVGDPNQLAPVGPGSVMADMIATRAFPRVGALWRVVGGGVGAVVEDIVCAVRCFCFVSLGYQALVGCSWQYQ